MPTLRELVLPLSSGSHVSKVAATGSIVLVGANGSGKSRLGAWLDIESPQASVVHRIAAQKSLTVPPACSTSALDAAENVLLFGHERASGAGDKLGNKWRSRPNTLMQDDYDKLLVYLFTEEFETSTKYRQECLDPAKRAAPPETRLDVVRRIWESVLPHRTLVVGGGRIETHPVGAPASRYNAAEMSDGERVIFYLLGHCMAARPDSIIIVDEPELHLHRSIQRRLWDAIEAERPDCLFVYLTHDLEFAATRANSTKVWIRGYDGKQWDWHVLEPSDALPERLFLEVVGSRKPILFVEGERESLDAFILSKVYPDFTIAPCGTAAAVIHATQSFATRTELHRLECRGIVDRDFRSSEEVAYLEQRSVFCLPVSEIENVILDEQVLEAVAESLNREAEAPALLGRVRDAVLAQLTAERDRLVSGVAVARIEQQLFTLDAKAMGVAGIESAVETLFAAIDVRKQFAAVSAEVDGIISGRDYKRALQIYNNKGLLPTVSQIFGFHPKEFVPHVRRLVASKGNATIVRALRGLLPVLGTSAI